MSYDYHTSQYGESRKPRIVDVVSGQEIHDIHVVVATLSQASAIGMTTEHLLKIACDPDVVTIEDWEAAVSATFDLKDVLA